MSEEKVKIRFSRLSIPFFVANIIVSIIDNNSPSSMRPPENPFFLSAKERYVHSRALKNNYMKDYPHAPPPPFHQNFLLYYYYNCYQLRRKLIG